MGWGNVTWKWLHSLCLDMSKQCVFRINMICQYLLVYVLSGKRAESPALLYWNSPAVKKKCVWGRVQGSTKDDDALKKSSCMIACGTAVCSVCALLNPFHDTQKKINLYSCESIGYSCSFLFGASHFRMNFQGSVTILEFQWITISNFYYWKWLQVFLCRKNNK